MATVNLGRVKPIYKGAYAAGTTYTPLDFVTYDGLTYFCILESTGNLPTNTTYWQMVVDGAAASAVTYDNGDSGLDATNVQAAIDEINIATVDLTSNQTVAGEKTFTEILTAEAGMLANIVPRDADYSAYPWGWSAMRVGTDQTGYPTNTALALTYVGFRGTDHRVVQFIIDKIGNGFWFRTRNSDDTAWEDFQQLATTAGGFGNTPVYHDQTSVRSLGVIYTNTQPHLMFITFRVWGVDAGASIHVNGVQVSLNDVSYVADSAGMTASAVVPVGGTYVYTKSGGSDHQIYEFY